MKQRIILLTIIMSFFNCTVTEKPEFVEVKNIKVVESTSEYITLTADALFMNKNDIGGELKTDEIKVFVNDSEMANISTKSFQVPAQDEFTIPLKARISTDSIFSDKNLGGLVNSLFSKKIKVQYKGDIVYKALGFSYAYEIDVTSDVKI